MTNKTTKKQTIFLHTISVSLNTHIYNVAYSVVVA